DPREADEVERHEGPKGPPPSRRVTRDATAFAGPFRGAAHCERGPVKPAPGDERPIGAVPESAGEHREHQIDARTRGTLPVSAEGNVEVVAQPGRQRNVPATPEILDARGLVR